jgi:hypothetical protein
MPLNFILYCAQKIRFLHALDAVPSFINKATSKSASTSGNRCRLTMQTEQKGHTRSEFSYCLPHFEHFIIPFPVVKRSLAWPDAASVPWQKTQLAYYLTSKIRAWEMRL